MTLHVCESPTLSEQAVKLPKIAVAFPATRARNIVSGAGGRTCQMWNVVYDGHPTCGGGVVGAVCRVYRCEYVGNNYTGVQLKVKCDACVGAQVSTDAMASRVVTTPRCAAGASRPEPHASRELRRPSLPCRPRHPCRQAGKDVRGAAHRSGGRSDL